MNKLKIRFKNVVCIFIALGMVTAYASGTAAQVQSGGYKESTWAVIGD